MSSALRQARKVKCATWAWRYVKRARSSAQRGRGATSSAQCQARNVGAAQRQARKRQRDANLVNAVVGEEQDRSRETTVPGTDSSN